MVIVYSVYKLNICRDAVAAQVKRVGSGIF